MRKFVFSYLENTVLSSLIIKLNKATVQIYVIDWLKYFEIHKRALVLEYPNLKILVLFLTHFY